MKISIGTLSKAFGLSDEALRFYEKKGLLHPVRENGNGYRVFELADIQRISNIQRLKSQGFTLEEIQRVYSGSGRQELEALYREKIAEMERKIAYDNHVLARMSASARTLQTAQEQLMPPRAPVAGAGVPAGIPLRAGHVDAGGEGAAAQAPLRGASADGLYHAHRPGGAGRRASPHDQGHSVPRKRRGGAGPFPEGVSPDRRHQRRGLPVPAGERRL